MISLFRRVQWWLRRRRKEVELLDELEFHVAEEARERQADGLAKGVATRAAQRELGNISLLRENVGAIWSWRLLDHIVQDIRCTWRTLRKSFGFTSAAVLILAIGIGATTATFSVVNSVLINPLPYPDSDALVTIVHTVDGRDEAYFGDAIYTLYSEQSRTFDAFGVWSPYAGTALVTVQGHPEEVRALAVSHGLLTALSVPPELGRAFSAEDDEPGSANTVMLTHGYWQRTFGGDPGVLSRVLTINGSPHQVIGVMPASFGFGGAVVNTALRMSVSDVVLPLRINRAAPVPVWRHLGVARLKPGVTLAEASADVARLVEIWSAPSERPAAFRDTKYGVSLRPLKQDVIGTVSTTLWVLMGTIGIVLVMACANVATLLLVRADARRREFAIRAALGASRTRLARAMLVESVTLASLGGVLGVGLAYGGVRLLVAIGPAELPRLSEIAVNPVALSFAVLVSLASGLMFGFAPILKHANTQPAAALEHRGPSAGFTRERQRSQGALVAVQMALAVVLLVGSGLMVRSFQALRHVDAGFVQPEYVQTVSVPIPPGEAAEPDRVTRMQHEMLDRIAAIPGVASAAYTSRLPMDTSGRTSSRLFAEGKLDARPSPPSRQVRFVSPGLFRTLGTPLIVGSEFTWVDVHDGREVGIVTESLARELWGSAAAALGQRIGEGNGVWRTVVGVSGDIRDEGLHQQPIPILFLPARLHGSMLGLPNVLPRRVAFVIRSERAGTESLLSDIREAVWAINANLPVAQMRTLGELYVQSMARTSFTLVMLAIAALVALLLGLSGLYAVVAYTVVRRRHEIAIRVALGARGQDIRGLFVRRALTMAGVGIVIGLGLTLSLTPLIRALLFGVGPLDPITLLTVPPLLATAVILAAYLPARRAARVDPMIALRCD